MIINFVIILLFISGFNCQGDNINRQSLNRNHHGSCLKGSCSPDVGNLLIGRTKYLTANSTCGLKEPQRYCVLGVTKNATQCYVCDSRQQDDPSQNTFSHTIENIVTRGNINRYEKWWQSENGEQNVYIQFDLEAEFIFTHMIMVFKTFRPAAMFIEKSLDYGTTWKTIAYFAQNCRESFPGIPTKTPNKLGDLYCETKYSSETPTTGGEIVLRMLPPHLSQAKDPSSPEIQDLLKVTSLRINFIKLHTFGDTLLDSRDDIKDKYYYALYELVVRGSCLCYGHANKCIRTPGVEYDDHANDKEMVHGFCQCTHNTGGSNCEQCLPLYNDRPWRPARNGDKNECKKCECHNHATGCHFDEDVYIASNNTSGGVCDNCLHNTEGKNCELCKENHWRDPSRSKEDPFTCRPCQCVKKGTTNDGKCDPETDESKGLVAGKCHCKENIDGPHCDRCKNGFFNLTNENPVGCEPCSCDLIGTRDNLGCDKITGSCSCKRYVAGRACDQCAPGYFGLSEEDPNGCKPCDCYIGGSVGNRCDAKTGQCTCKPNMTGRRCETPISGYFCPSLTHLLYEAEDALKINQDRTKDAYRQIYPDRKPSWTGLGFVRFYEGGSIEFHVGNIINSGVYNIVARYEQHPEIETRFNINIIRSDPYTDPNGPCKNHKREDDVLTTSLPGDNVFHKIQPSVCLEGGKAYKIVVELQKLNSGSNRDNSILLDSIILVPVLNKLSEFKSEEAANILDEYEYYRCEESLLSPYHYEVHEVCQKFACGFGVSSFTALPCKCHQTGSESNECDLHTGECRCKPNVIGRNCDQCAPSTWGFGPNGCKPCNCHSNGAKDNFCDSDTGACSCYENAHGQKCDSCKEGFWQFPHCLPCRCHGNSDKCNQTTGQCIDCRDNTQGDQCENCKEGYYGEPSNGQPCKECMCPGINKFANSCYFNSRDDRVECACEKGYERPSCDRCAVNYYGNPLEAGGSCKMCECNGNIDVNDRESCDEHTGKCSNCKHNTAGDHCEVCSPGFYGNASSQSCTACNCNPDGTEGHSDGNCDAVTGQCKCLPNVIGRRCDQCRVDYYGLSSRQGCSECDCDSDGTENSTTSCEQDTGKCNCLPSRGGRTCSECSYGYWGDPTQDNCKKCECNPSGSTSIQCDKLTGQCPCRKGITGYYCDRCDRGTYGQIPECRQCGECFDNWSGILSGLNSQVNTLESEAMNIVVSSSSSVDNFSKQYEELEAKLNDIKKLLSANLTDRQIKALSDAINSVEKQIAQKRESRGKIYSVETWTDPAGRLTEAKNEYEESKVQVQEITEKAMALIESTARGAQESINKTRRKSEEISHVLDGVKHSAGNVLKPLAEKLKSTLDSSQEMLNKYNAELKDVLENTLKNLSQSISSVNRLNTAVCGGETSESKPCDSKCGGATCGVCGSNTSSCPGLADTYWNLVSVKQKFDNLYNETETSFKRLLTQWRNISLILKNSNKDISALEESAQSSLKSLNDKREEIKKLTETIKNYVEENAMLPKKIEETSDYVINKEQNVDLQELEKILNEVKGLAETINTESVEQQALESRKSAQHLLSTVESVAKNKPSINEDIKRINDSLSENINQTKENEVAIELVVDENTEVKETLETGSENLKKVGDLMNTLQKAIDELKSTIDADKDKNLNLNKEQLKSRVKESRVSLGRTKEALNELNEKFISLTNAIQKGQSQDENDVNSLLVHLINLKSNILKKRDILDQRENKLKEYEDKIYSGRAQVETLNKKVEELKATTERLQMQIYNKLDYFSNCN